MKQITAAIIGLGHRGRGTYAEYARLFPEKLKITAVADTDPEKVAEAAAVFGIPAEHCFNSAAALLAAPRLADAAFVCTQDRRHAEHCIPAMEKGYHILLEKPVSPSAEECTMIRDTAHKTGRLVVVCHVLRYTPFYRYIKKLIEDGTVGEITTIQASENVGYYHQAHSFVRGNWRNSEETSPMILAKCCHDLDILLWLAQSKPLYVSSFGSRKIFTKDHEPAGCTDYCLGGCKAKTDCIFDAEKIYITDPKTGIAHGIKDWSLNIFSLNPTVESVREYLKTGQYGRCVYRCDNNVVDHQVLTMELENKATIAFTLSGLTSDCFRTIKVMGSAGEIEGRTDTQQITWCRFGEKARTVDVRTLAEDFSGHDGGDNAMLDDLCSVLQDDSFSAKNKRALPSSIIDASLLSHYAAFAAEESRRKGGIPVSVNQSNT